MDPLLKFFVPLRYSDGGEKIFFSISNLNLQTKHTSEGPLHFRFEGTFPLQVRVHFFLNMSYGTITLKVRGHLSRYGFRKSRLEEPPPDMEIVGAHAPREIIGGKNHRKKLEIFST